MTYIERFSQLYFELGIKSTVYKNTLWVAYNRMVQPFGPACIDYSLSITEARGILSEIGGLLIRWSDGFGENKCEEWYAVISNKFTELNKLSQKTRYYVKKGNKYNEVKLIDARYLMKHGYEIYTRSFQRYRGNNKPELSEKQFTEMISKYNSFDDIINIWGVFNGGRLIAFTINYLFDKTESFFSMINYDPEYLKYFPSYALYYKLSQHYLEKEGFEYINEGFRNLLHNTEVHEFLQKKFFFKKAHTNLHIVHKPYVDLLLKSARPMRYILGKIEPKIGALYLQESISRKCSKNVLTI